MTKTSLEQLLYGEVLEEGTEITIVQLCHTCAVRAEVIEAMVDQGILEPSGKLGHHWCFPANSIRRTRIALRLQQDLGVNLAGAALALELMERIDELKARMGVSTSRR